MIKKNAFLIQHPLIVLVSRWFIGITFIYASLCKIYMPMQFAVAIHNYQLVPDTIARFLAILFPWFELICGILLLVGLFIPGAIRIIIGMLIIFIGALSIDLIRGIDINCGCISNCFTNEPDSQGLKQALVMDSIYLVFALPVLFFQDKWLSIDHWRKN
jgi:uncharacterized membrane protein YphA (DoxX/SURF4 family)